MVEVPPCPAVARSDSQQQLDLPEFARFLSDVGLEHGLPLELPTNLPIRPAVGA